MTVSGTSHFDYAHVINAFVTAACHLPVLTLAGLTGLCALRPVGLRPLLLSDMYDKDITQGFHYPDLLHDILQGFPVAAL